VAAYNCVDGVTLNTKRSDDGYDATEIIVAECRVNLKLHSASANYIIHDNFLSNTWSSAYVRTNCAECYTAEKVNTNSRCANVSGI
jgi:hypothetical protein